MVQASAGSKLGKFVGAKTEQTREDALFQKGKSRALNEEKVV